MRHYLIAILFLVGFSSNLPAREPALLTILSEPAGCLVRIDSIEVGHTPLRNFMLEPGKYSVDVLPPARGTWNIQSRHYQVDARANEPQTINAIFTEPIYINSNPFGASVFSDTSFLGTTPLHLSFERFRGREITLSKPGYQTSRFALNQAKSYFIELASEKDYLTQGDEAPDLGLMKQSHARPKVALLALSVTSQWLGFYFKNEADANFAKYEMAANPQQAEQFWDKTKQNDRLTTISLTVSYAALAGLIYYIVWR